MSFLGHYDAAMKTSIKLCEYDDILNPFDIYSILALSALQNKFYGICSKAFVKVIIIKSVFHFFILKFILIIYIIA